MHEMQNTRGGFKSQTLWEGSAIVRIISSERDSEKYLKIVFGLREAAIRSVNK